ncbi:MAG: hypothetical protein RMJ97_00755 [Raineya sp.]|nr:hypothetical protein [Raineya sp.]MDW8295389.1 hypothetical protein [Raineya sp.]
MKKIWITLLIFSFLQSLSAQERLRERFLMQKKEFVIKRIELNAEQQKKFPAFYEEYIFKLADVQKQIRQLKIEAAMLSLSDAEINADIDKMLKLKQQELDLQKEYITKFRAILTPKQMIAMFRAEREFLRVALRALKDD